MTILSWTEDYGDALFNGFNLSELNIDEAYLNTSNIVAQTYSLYSKFDQCVGCKFLLVPQFSEGTLKLKHVPEIIYRLVEEQKFGEVLEPSAEYICEFGEDFGEFGIYNLNVVNKSCEITTAKEPVSIAFPALTVLIIFCALSLCIYGAIYFYHRFYINKQDDEQPVTSKPRVASLDTFRGINIIIMIFVNYGAGGYSILDHAVWNGLHLADLVFPWFMWIMGVCIPISLASSFRRNVPRKSMFLNVLKRSIKLICLGLFLDGGSQLEHLEIQGILQTFGITYFICSTTCIFLMGQDGTKAKNSFVGKYLTDLFASWKGWVVILIVFLAYIFNIVGCPQGYFRPGGIHDDGKDKQCMPGSEGYLKWLVKRYGYGDYEGNDGDEPGAFRLAEAIVGYLTSTIHVFIGVQAGVTLQVYQNHKDRLIRWIIWGMALALIGGGLSGFSRDDGIIPVNKDISSLSFVMVTCGFAFLLQAFCYFIVDVKHWWSGKPFIFAGMNAILMYLGHGLVEDQFPIVWTLSAEHGQNTHFFRLFENMWGSASWLLVSYYLYKIQFFFIV